MQTDRASGNMENVVVGKVVRHLFPFMIVLTMVNFIDRTNIGLAALTMNKDLGIDPAAFGFAAGIFFLGYVLFEVPSNIILHRVGANIWLARIMFTWGLVCMGMAFVSGATGLYIMRFLLGVAEAGFIPGITLYILLWIPLRQRARITAYWILATPFAGIIGGPLGGLLLQLDGVLGLKGWQWLFVAEGLPAVILAVATYFYLTPTPAKAQWLSEDERQWLQRTLAAEAEAIHAQTRQKFTISAALVNWRVLVLGLLYIGMNMGLQGINTWMPTIIKSLGTLSNLEVSSVSAIPWICGAVAAVLWGRHSDRRNERYVSLAIALIVGAIGFAASAYVASPLLGIVCLSIAVMGIIAGYTVFWVVPGTFLTGAAVAGGIALVNSMGNIGGFIAPFTIGWIKQTTGSFTDALLVLAGAMAVSSVIAFLIRPTRTTVPVGAESNQPARVSL
jgi:MFS transporter, ACS family, tartrate transporter